MILRINDRIRNRKIEYFNNFNLNLRYDSVASSFSFGFLYNSDNQEHVDVACLGHYHIVTVEHNGELILTGCVLSEGFNAGSKKEFTAFSGYSLPGVLEDCNIPTSLYPLQSDTLNLREIAQKLLEPFKIKMIIDQSVSALMEKTYDVSKAKPTQTIKEYLTELASQRNIIITHNAHGNLVFTKAKADQKPIFHFEKGLTGTRFGLTFDGQGMHSEITVLKEADTDGGNAGEATVRNPFVPFVFRPLVVTQSAGDDNDTEQAARNILASELKNVKVIIITDRWEIDGRMIRPNMVVSVKNPDIYIFKKTNFFVESVDYSGNHEAMTATLTCVLTEVYNGNLPHNIFEGINLH